MQDTLILKEKRQKLKEKKRKYDLEYRAKNKSKLSEQWKSYDQKNKAEIRERKKKYVKQRRSVDPVFKIRHYLSKSINFRLKSMLSSKCGASVTKHLAYSIQELKEYLQSLFYSENNKTLYGEYWMNWGNYGKYNSKTWKDNEPSTWTWTIDHIIPQSNLPYTSMQDDNFKKCWALENLRPLSAKQNLMDGVNRTRHNSGGKND